VTNGKAYFVDGDGRGKWARRWRDLIEEIASDLGGDVSEGQRQLIRRAATLALACERIEAKAAAGEEIDTEGYGKLSDRLGRCFQRLGLRRVSLDAAPSLADIVAEIGGDG
jgi:hypothetical protein